MTGIDLSGWLFMVLAMSGIITLTVYSFGRVLRNESKKKRTVR